MRLLLMRAAMICFKRAHLLPRLLALPCRGGYVHGRVVEEEDLEDERALTEEVQELSSCAFGSTLCMTIGKVRSRVLA